MRTPYAHPSSLATQSPFYPHISKLSTVKIETELPKNFRRRIAHIDCDDVLCDYYGMAVEVFARRTGVDLTGKIVSHAMYKEVGLTQDQFTQILIEEEFIRRAKPLPGARETMNTLLNEGFFVEVVTARSYHPNAREFTLKWLQQHRIPFDTLHITTYPLSKAEYVLEHLNYTPTLVIDDHAANIEDCARLYQDATVLYPAYMWNDEVKSTQNVHRFRNMTQLAEDLPQIIANHW